MDLPRALVAAVAARNTTDVADLLGQHPELRARLDDPLPGLSFDGTLLLAAVSNADRPMIDLLLANGASINQRSHWWAGGFGVLDSDSGLADFLIERGATLDLYAASRLARIDTVTEMLRADPSRVHGRGGDGQTPLHVAANVDIARLLVDHGADIDARDVDHESTPAQYAIRDRTDVARFLVARGARTDLLLAAALGDLDRVRTHVETDPGSIAMTVSQRYFPMANPRAGGTIYLWTLGRNKTAHAVAGDFAHDDVYRWLMERTPPGLSLSVACEVNDEPLMSSLAAALRAGSIVLSHDERRRIVDAAENNDGACVRRMLMAGWPAEARGNHGATALHFSAWHGDAVTVRELLTAGPPLEALDDYCGLTPLGWAFHGSVHGWNARRGDYGGVVRVLLDAGAKAPAGGNIEASEAVRQALTQR